MLEGREIWLQLVEVIKTQGWAPTDPAIQAVLECFREVFAKPTGLPLPWSRGHHI